MRVHTASTTQAWTQSIATAQSGSIFTLSAGLPLATASLLAISLARRQIASHAFVLASSINALLSSGCQFSGNSAFAASTLSTTGVTAFARATGCYSAPISTQPLISDGASLITRTRESAMRNYWLLVSSPSSPLEGDWGRPGRYMRIGMSGAIRQAGDCRAGFDLGRRVAAKIIREWLAMDSRKNPGLNASLAERVRQPTLFLYHARAF
jgi:hypothetical protein